MQKILFFCLLCIGINAQGQTNVYVDSSITISGNGVSWATAYKTLNEALNFVNPSSTTVQYVINVAKGTYYTAGVQAGTNRDSAFAILRGGVRLLGGYPTGGGVRNYQTNTTILSGNIGSVTDSNDNAYHVLIISNISSTSDSNVIDGFTITKGYANGTGAKNYNGYNCDRSYGAGIYDLNTSDKVRFLNNTLTGNVAAQGAAMYATTASPVINNCTFLNNRANTRGSAILCFGSSMNISSSSFSGNTNCAIYTNGTTYFSIASSSFSGNTGASSLPGAIFVASPTSSSSITGCSFTDNTGDAGGALYASSGSGTVAISSCTFNNNSTTALGGGVYILSGTLTNCTFTNNTSTQNGGAVYTQGNVTGCTFNGNKCSAGNGGGGGVYVIYGTLSGCTFNHDTAALGGAVYCNSCDITNSICSSNYAMYGGGIFTYTGSTTISGCTLSGNTAALNGGGAYMLGNTTSTHNIKNTLVAGNLAAINGGGLYMRNTPSGSSVTNSTLVGNNAVNGLALYDSSANQSMVNVIIWNGSNGIYNYLNSNPSVIYSIIQGGYTGTANLNTDPLFVNPSAIAAPTTTGNYSLMSCSPAINAGNNIGTYTNITDVAGNPRLYSTLVDIGAYEYQAASSVPAAITGNSAVCAFNTIQLSNTTTGGTWSSSNTAIATVNTTGLVTGVAPGTDTIYYTSGTGICQQSSMKIITVSAAPVVNQITGSNTVCFNSTTQLNNTTPGGTWSSSAPSIISVNSTGLITGQQIGSATISYTVNGSNCNTTVTFPVTVSPIPSVAAITGPTSVCIGSTIQENNATPGGAWNTNTPSILSIDNNGMVTGIAAGSGSITYTVTNSAGCSKQVIRSINVPAGPSVAAISGNNTVCLNSTTQLSNTTPGGVWSSADNSIAVINNNGLVTGMATGTDTIFYTVTGSPCITKVYKVITVLPAPVVNPITGNNSICVHDATQLTCTTPGGTWSSSNPNNATVDNNGMVTGVNPGVTTIQYTINDGTCSATATSIVEVNGPITGVNQSNITLTAQQSGANYQWVRCPSYSAIAGQNGQSFTATSSGDYAVILTMNNCTDTSACYNVTVTAVNTVSNSTTLRMYPNPAHDHLFIETDKNNVPEQVLILDITGQLLISKTPNGATTEIDLSSYTPGVYLIEIITKQEKVIQRITRY